MLGRRKSLCHINTMKNRDDLLSCFPSRTHLSLMPKPICSPARPSEPVNHQHHHHHHRRHNSNMFVKNRRSYDSDMSEPTSPKVTCAGQIKVRPKNSKNWQSVMEEIERIHKKKKKRSSAWIESLGFKKDVMQFLTCLRNISFEFRCFGSFPTTDASDDDDDDDDEEYKENYEEDMRVTEESGDESVFSKWFMILPENGGNKEEESKEEMIRPCLVDDETSVPPPNALLLMRCRSAPAKSWLEEEEEEEKEKQRLVVMRCGADFSKLSDDIAKETWVAGGDIKDMLSKSLKR